MSANRRACVVMMFGLIVGDAATIARGRSNGESAAEVTHVHLSDDANLSEKEECAPSQLNQLDATWEPIKDTIPGEPPTSVMDLWNNNQLLIHTGDFGVLMTELEAMFAGDLTGISTSLFGRDVRRKTCTTETDECATKVSSKNFKYPCPDEYATCNVSSWYSKAATTCTCIEDYCSIKVKEAYDVNGNAGHRTAYRCMKHLGKQQTFMKFGDWALILDLSKAAKYGAVGAPQARACIGQCHGQALGRQGVRTEASSNISKAQGVVAAFEKHLKSEPGDDPAWESVAYAPTDDENDEIWNPWDQGERPPADLGRLVGNIIEKGDGDKMNEVFIAKLDKEAVVGLMPNPARLNRYPDDNILRKMTPGNKYEGRLLLDFLKHGIDPAGLAAEQVGFFKYAYLDKDYNYYDTPAWLPVADAPY